MQVDQIGDLVQSKESHLICFNIVLVNRVGAQQTS